MEVALLGAAAATVATHFKQSAVFVVILPIATMVLTRTVDLSTVGRALVMLVTPLANLVLLISGPLAPSMAYQTGLRLQPFVNAAANVRGLGEAATTYLPFGLAVVGVALGLARRSAYGAYLTVAMLSWTLPWPFAGPLRRPPGHRGRRPADPTAWFC